MIDWFVVLTPLLAVPIVLLLVFVGCTLQTGGLQAEPIEGRTVDFVVRFPADLEPRADTYFVRVNISWPSEYGEERRISLYQERDADGPHDFTFSQLLAYGEYDVWCKVTALTEDGDVIGDADLLVSEPYPYELVVDEVADEEDEGSMRLCFLREDVDGDAPFRAVPDCEVD